MKEESATASRLFVQLGVLGLGLVWPTHMACAQPQNVDGVLRPSAASVDAQPPKGIQAGGFIFTPGIEVKETFDDNVFRSSTNRVSDYLTEVKPALAVQTKWDRHSLYLGGVLDYGSYAEGSRRAFMDAGAVVSGQYDIADETYLSATVTHNKWHTGVGTGEDIIAEQQRNYATTKEEIKFVRDLSYIGLEVTADNQNINLLSDKESLAPRDMTRQNGQNLETMVDYEITPGNGPYAKVKYGQARYQPSQFSAREVKSMDYQAGYGFYLMEQLNGLAYGGFQTQTFTNPKGSAEQAYYGANANWEIGKVAQASFVWNQSFNPSTEIGAVGVLITNRTLKYNHNISDSIALGVSGGVDDYEYVGRAANLAQEDRYYYGGASATYKFNRYAALKAAFDHRQRSKESDSAEYKDNRGSLSVNLMH